MFKETSMMVKSWVLHIENGLRTEEDIPNISNLREMVLKVLKKNEKK